MSLVVLHHSCERHRPPNLITTIPFKLCWVYALLVVLGHESPHVNQPFYEFNLQRQQTKKEIKHEQPLNTYSIPFPGCLLLLSQSDEVESCRARLWHSRLAVAWHRGGATLCRVCVRR